jgi:hypothetical protein
LPSHSLTAISPAPSRAHAPDSSDARLNQGIAERSALGLPTDAESMSRLGEPGVDAGSGTWGIPMTQDEMARIDVSGRMQFASLVAARVLPEAQLSPAYAGAYIDQQGDGGLVVLWTSAQPGLESDLAARMPDPSRGLSFRVVSVSYDTLMRAKETAWSAQASEVLGAKPLAVAIDEKGNRLVVYVAPSLFEAAKPQVEQLAGLVGAPVSVKVGEVEEPASCNSRNDCHTPFRSGIKITRGSTECTMGFAIARDANPADLQFVTTGHCGGGDWDHPGFGTIGSVLESEYRDGGWDMMRVQMPNSQGTNRIYGEARRVSGRRAPIQDELVCASLRITNWIDCGTVSDTDRDATYNNGFVIKSLADTTGIEILGGDSGSPVYVQATSTSALAIGLAATSTSDLVAKLGAPFADWGAGVVISGP